MRRGIILSVAILSTLQYYAIGQNSDRNNMIVIQTNNGEKGKELEIHFQKDKAFDKPTFAFWLEDMDGKYIETLYVTKFLGSGIFQHSKLAEGRPLSKPGPAKRPSSLPYWLHKRNVKADGVTYLPTPDKPVPDAITCATPQNNFILNTVATVDLPSKFKLLMEINQPWDYNKYWNKELHADEFDYTYSCQPALVFSVDIDQYSSQKEYTLSIVGHSHYSGKDGNLYPDISTFSTALNIVKEVKAILK